MIQSRQKSAQMLIVDATHPHSNFIIGVTFFARRNCRHGIDHVDF